VPAAGQRNSAMEMVSIGSIDLSDAQRIDASASDE
jgi:ABC-type transporter Mla MlaB component